MSFAREENLLHSEAYSKRRLAHQVIRRLNGSTTMGVPFSIVHSLTQLSSTTSPFPPYLCVLTLPSVSTKNLTEEYQGLMIDKGDGEQLV